MSNNLSRLYSYNQHEDDKMGSDGCLQFNHKNNRGLDEIWANGSPWKNLYDSKYVDMNIPDFWVAAATATIKISSNGRHDMWHTFMWGRKQRDSCKDEEILLDIRRSTCRNNYCNNLTHSMKS